MLGVGGQRFPWYVKLDVVNDLLRRRLLHTLLTTVTVVVHRTGF